MGAAANAGDVDGTSINGSDGTTIGNVTDSLKTNITNTVSIAPVISTRLTYSVSATLVPGATPTDAFTIIGSASKTIYITRIGFSCIGTGTNTRTFTLVKRSTANTGGTSTTPTIVPHDSANAAATAVVRAYTVNPTSLGTSVGTLRGINQLVASGTSTMTSYTVWDFGDLGQQHIVLNGVAQTLALNLGGVTISSGVLIAFIEWFEV